MEDGFLLKNPIFQHSIIPGSQGGYDPQIL